MKALLAGAMAVVLGLVGTTANADEIDIDSSQLFVRAYAGTYDEDTLRPTLIPTDTSNVASVGGSRAESTYDFTHAGFLVGMDHTVGGNADDNSYGRAIVTFSVDEDATYEVEGTYDFDGGLGHAYTFAYLYDATAGKALLDNVQYSRDVTSETFTVGEKGGTYYNTLFGSLTGDLIAGHEYSLQFEAWSYDAKSGVGSVSGVGDFALNITFAPVPEPSTLALFGMGLAGMAWLRRRRLGVGREL